MQYQVDCPPEALFDLLTDHERFGRLIGQRIERVVEGAPHRNGLGAVRRIYLLPFWHFDETVTAYERPTRMSYRVSRGSPIKNHEGQLTLNATSTGTALCYRITFDARLPGTGWLLAMLIKAPLARALARLQRKGLPDAH
ncbi:SRPBCC family protein [Simiduia sp. 21SJ11W-1]|uniref:SRPBCC family protein n=1 Tax=Simiduia sp. 21SJ11W-1 TaxID=2909669 RepID=UPI0020A1E0C2|nr:SRPBCC family protein [Simiduia sp. 21SJ11W-1]UTA47210.1 SRPBCC family protein [Simiduia sp. 21SJ11W-1]